MQHRIFTTSVASVYPHYVAKVEKKGRSQAELDETIEWLTGFDEAQLQHHLDAGTTFEDFFAAAHLNPTASLITGSVCGVKVQEVEDPLMRQIRYLDKLVDELAKGRPMEKVLRSSDIAPRMPATIARTPNAISTAPEIRFTTSIERSLTA